MYDSYIGQKVYRKLKARVEQLWYAADGEDAEDVMDAIQDALKDDEISGTQYDNLVGELQEMGYYLG